MITANTAHVYAMREREDNYIPKESFAAEVLKKIDSEIQNRALKGFFDVAIHKSVYYKLNYAELDWIKNQLKLMGFGMYENEQTGLQICW
jgi:hypothetical protein